MVPQAGQIHDDCLQVQKCVQGDSAALGDLRDRFHGTLKAILLARGGNLTETEDILADLWADCVPDGGERPFLLEKFSGKCSLQSWLATVATRRWIDLKRKQARRPEASPHNPEQPDENAFDRLPASVAPVSEDALVDLLRESLKAAFEGCESEVMLLLRLVHIHGLTQREIGRMLGWHEAKVSRALSEAMEQIESDTLRELKKRDPWLELTWQDFLDLCQTNQIGFI
jgi:RNA polymerase sigma factor (sigma-70 family)